MRDRERDSDRSGERGSERERAEGRGHIHMWEASDLSVYSKEQNRLEENDGESRERG